MDRSSNSVATEGLFTVSSTVDQTITVVQGGGGYKKIVATGGGGYSSPLILLGNTTQDGSFYDSHHRQPDRRGTRVPQPGRQSVIDASLDPFGVIIYGGIGNSTIYGGGGGDQIFGGSGQDAIFAGTGNDLIHANDGINLDLSHPLHQIIAQGLPALLVVNYGCRAGLPTSDPALLGHGSDLPRHRPRHRAPQPRLADQLINSINGDAHS